MLPFSRITFLFSSLVAGASCSASTDVPLRVGVTEGRKVIHQTCSYEIGVSFSPKAGGIRAIKEVFGPPTVVNLPIELNLLVVNTGWAEVFTVKQFGGQGVGFRYGPPIKIIAGTRRLTPGTYFVRIELTKVPESMSAFEARIFIDKIPKTICGE